MNPAFFESSHYFVKNKTQIFVNNPDAKTYNEFNVFIKDLDIEESPIWSGLPVSAQKVQKKQKFEDLIDLLRKVQDVGDEQI